jgi:hypothetical protein
MARVLSISSFRRHCCWCWWAPSRRGRALRRLLGQPRAKPRNFPHLLLQRHISSSSTIARRRCGCDSPKGFNRDPGSAVVVWLSQPDSATLGRANMPSWNASPPPAGSKTSDPGGSIPNYAKPTAATSLRRGQSFRNRTARDNHLFLPPPAPTPSQTQPNPNPHTENSCPPNADARKIRLLWAKVMAGKRSGAMRLTQVSLARVK